MQWKSRNDISNLPQISPLAQEPLKMRRPILPSLKLHLAPLLILVALSFAAYGKLMGHEFLLNWDDNFYVTDNDAIKGFSAQHLQKALTGFYAGNYAPVQMFSYMVDYALWGGLKPAGFFFTNVLIHTLNGLLFYFLLIHVGARRLAAFVAAFIFIAHPVQVESVAWISQRKNLLAMFFSLISFILYTLHRERGSENGKAAYVGSVCAFLLSLMAKSVAVILPPILLLYDLSYERENGLKKLLLDKIPYLLAAGFFAWIAMMTQDPQLTGDGGRAPYYGGSPLATFFTMLPVFVRYLGLLFWPVNLSAVYDPPIKTGVDLSVVLSALLLALLAACAVYLYRKRRDLFFWFSLFFVALIPVSQIVPLVTLMNDRYLYFPMLGAAACAGAVIASLVSAPGKVKPAAAVVAAMVLLTLPALSMARGEVWRNSKALWSDALAKHPQVSVAWTGIGEAYIGEENYEQALKAFLKGSDLESPKRFVTRKFIGCLYTQVGQLEKGREVLLQLVKDYPTSDVALLRLGDNYSIGGEPAKAEDAYRRALALAPRSAEACNGLGNMRLQAGDISGAMEFYRRALTIEPLNSVALNQLGILYTKQGGIAAGRALFLKSIADNPRSSATWINLGGNYYMAGELAAAEKAYQSALAIAPHSWKAMEFLATVDLRMGKLDAARELFGKAIDAGADRGEAEYNLACIESLAGHSDKALDHLMSSAANGFRDFRRIAGNRELDSIRNTPEFQKIVGSLQRSGEGARGKRRPDSRLRLHSKTGAI
jgi:tetratricopeptide (TPR) repeat protein